MIKKVKKTVVALAFTLLAAAPFMESADAATVTGPGGTARINYIDYNNIVSWSVDPAVVYNAYAFYGDIYFGNGTSVGLFESGWGSEGGTESAGASTKSATLTGTAYATNGSAYSVLPGVTAYPQ